MCDAGAGYLSGVPAGKTGKAGQGRLLALIAVQALSPWVHSLRDGFWGSSAGVRIGISMWKVVSELLH